MKLATLAIVVVATAVNVGIWFWSRPPQHSGTGTTETARPAATTTDSVLVRCDGVAPLAPNTTARRDLPRVSRTEPAAPATTSEVVPDQPWLAQTHDGVLQLAQTPAFTNRLSIGEIDCKGSQCRVSGATRMSVDGRSNGSPAVAELMKAMNDGQIAGGDSGRAVGLHYVRPRTDGTGVEFALSIDAVDEPFVNPCQSILDSWKATHPEDFLQNPDHPTIRNYRPPEETRQ